MIKHTIHKQDGYFLIVCKKCNEFIKGTSPLHCEANYKIHSQSKACEERAKAWKMLGGETNYSPSERDINDGVKVK